MTRSHRMTVLRPNPAHPHFCRAHDVRKDFTLCSSQKSQRIIFHDTWKLHEIQFSVSIDKVLLEYSHTHLFMYCLWLLSQRRLETETIWLTKPETQAHTLSGPLQKKLASLHYKWLLHAQTGWQKVYHLKQGCQTHFHGGTTSASRLPSKGWM